MTLEEGRALLNQRIGGQYNSDAEGKALLNLWLNTTARMYYEDAARKFNIASTTTIPAITDNQFTLPATAKILLELLYSATGDRLDEIDVPFDEDGTTIVILENDRTPTRMVTQSKYVDITAGESFPTDIWDYLIVESGAKLAKGLYRKQDEIMLNEADKAYQRWAHSFSVRKKTRHANVHHADGVIIQKSQDDIYSAGEITQ